MKNRKILFAVAVILLIGLVTRLLWLTFLLVLIVVSYLPMSNTRVLRKHPLFTKIVKPVIVFLFIFFLAISVRLFLFEVFAIPSGSMENTLLPGNVILVNKLSYGPKMPCSPFEIPWLNILFAQNKKAWDHRNEVWWKHIRLNGVSKIKKNDVVVFRHPYSRRRDFFLIKRCVGLPGDTLLINNSTVIVNSDTLQDASGVKKIYRAWINDPSFTERILKKNNYEIIPGKENSISSENFIYLALNMKQTETLRKYKEVDSLTIKLIPKEKSNYVYDKGNQTDWTINDFGPFTIPFKGMTIKLTENNYGIFHRLIAKIEKENLEFLNGNFYLNGKRTDTFTFSKDYYFMMGDNRSFSNDSRFFGVIPCEEIVGKATVILFSTSKNAKCESLKVFNKII